MKKLIVAGIVLLSLGLVVCVGAFGALGFRFEGLKTERFESKTLELQGDFRSIRIQGDTEHITICHTMYPTLETTPRLEYMDNEKQPLEISVENGTLLIRRVDERKWYERFFVLGETPTLVLYLPEEDFGDLSIENSTGSVNIAGDFDFDRIQIKCSTGDVACHSSAETISVETGTGDITLSNLSAKEITAKVSTGRVQLQKVSCDTLVTEGSTGKAFLTDVVAERSITVKRSTGDVSFTACDAPSIRVDTDTGDVRGSLLTGKTFKTETHTGKVQVPENYPKGGTCEISTSTGDITFK